MKKIFSKLIKIAKSTLDVVESLVEEKQQAVKQPERRKLNDEETDELINHYLCIVDELRQFFENNEEEDNEDYHDLFLDKYFIVEQVVKNMIDVGLIERVSAEQAIYAVSDKKRKDN